MTRRHAILCWFLGFGLACAAAEPTLDLMGPLLRQVFGRPGPNASEARKVLETTTTRLRGDFDAWLEDPAVFGRRALRECAIFPEGRIYPFAIPAMAYVNLGLSDPVERAHAAAQVRKLINLLIPVVRQEVKPPGNRLENLTDYGLQGTYLATLHLTLTSYNFVSDDSTYDALHKHLSGLLREELTRLDGKPLSSYPAYTWHFDTIMALVSLELNERQTGGGSAADLLNKHLDWRRAHAMDAATQLPLAYTNGLPRGCDVPMQVCLLQHVAPKEAGRLYRGFVEHHWVDYGFLAGFREWPKGRQDGCLGDVDSGPLVLGLGPTATGVGVGAAKAAGDTARFERLARQLQPLPTFVKMLEQQGQSLFGNRLRVDSRYLTGFVYGDAILFYALTWEPYPRAAGQAKAATAGGANDGDGTVPHPMQLVPVLREMAKP